MVTERYQKAIRCQLAMSGRAATTNPDQLVIEIVKVLKMCDEYHAMRLGVELYRRKPSIRQTMGLIYLPRYIGTTSRRTFPARVRIAPFLELEGWV